MNRFINLTLLGSFDSWVVVLTYTAFFVLLIALIDPYAPAE